MLIKKKATKKNTANIFNTAKNFVLLNRLENVATAKTDNILPIAKEQMIQPNVLLLIYMTKLAIKQR